MSRPLAPQMSRKCIGISETNLPDMLLQNRRISERLDVLDEDIVYSGDPIPANKQIIDKKHETTTDDCYN
jgi:hypothetical protein